MVIVVFRSTIRSDADLTGIDEAGARMYELASQMPGFVSYKEFKAEDGELLSLVEFETEEQVRAWHAQPEHQAVQQIGRDRVFETYDISVCATIRRYGFTKAGGRVERAA